VSLKLKLRQSRDVELMLLKVSANMRGESRSSPTRYKTMSSKIQVTII